MTTIRTLFPQNQTAIIQTLLLPQKHHQSRVPTNPKPESVDCTWNSKWTPITLSACSYSESLGNPDNITGSLRSFKEESMFWAGLPNSRCGWTFIRIEDSWISRIGDDRIEMGIKRYEDSEWTDDEERIENKHNNWEWSCCSCVSSDLPECR